MSYAAWGVSWLGSWGDSWGPLHEVEETHRPRTHPKLKLRAILDVKHPVKGGSIAVIAGRVSQVRHVVAAPISVSARARLSGGNVSSGAGRVKHHVGSRASLSGCQVVTSAGQLVARAGVRYGIHGAALGTKVGKFNPHTGSKQCLRGSSIPMRCGSFDDSTTVQNPTDEELLVIAVQLLTSKQVNDITHAFR